MKDTLDIVPKSYELKNLIHNSVSNNQDAKTAETLRVAFLSDVTISGIETYLEYFLNERSLRADYYFGAFDNVLQEAMNPAGGLYSFSPDFIIVILKFSNIFQCFWENKTPESGDLNEISNLFSNLIASIRKATNAVILINNFERIPFTIASPLVNSERKHSVFLSALNSTLANLSIKFSNVFVIDSEKLQDYVGYKNYLDFRYWAIAHDPFTQEAKKRLAHEYSKFILASKGKIKKCIVLDCDNTLWGGIIGEDGIQGIAIDDSTPQGSAFRRFQQSLSALKNNGIMLALCSKNNIEDVKETFQTHKGMPLQWDDFIAVAVNWNNKAENIKTIAETLNIGLDSIVFIDDSRFEIDFVKKIYPEVTCLLLEKNIEDFPVLLATSNYFNSVSLTDEDLKRNDMMKAEQNRKEILAKIEWSDIFEYFEFLEMEIDIFFAREEHVSRAEQLFQRTNQFNMTTQRFFKEAIFSMLSSKTQKLLCLSVKDKFGDYGFTGLAVLEFANKKATITSFLLSCRIMGRNIEDVLLRACFDVAKSLGCSTLFAKYIKTDKNKALSEYYEKHGFHIIDGSLETECTLEKECESDIMTPKYFKKIRFPLNL